ncbi:Dabb family protein [Bacillus toyonensis]|uniref:Dabb family protein n=1 Tax=Bacillus toyonensis TaxID=155322 RepID=UPI003D1BA8B1
MHKNSNMKTQYEHLVFFKWNESITQEKEQQILKEILNFKELIPGILELSAGLNILEETKMTQGFTMGLRITFESKEALELYDTHPVHQTFKEHLIDVYDNFIAIDYPINNR